MQLRGAADGLDRLPVITPPAIPPSRRREQQRLQPGRRDALAHARFTVLAAPSDLQLFAAGVVLVSPAGNLHGLSRPEL
jgi:hypothetical protein